MINPIRMTPLRSVAIFVLMALISFTLAQPGLAQGSSPGKQLQAMTSIAKEGVEAAEQNNLVLMQHEYDELHERWETFEDQIREQDPVAYVELEGALHGVRDALQAEPVDLEVARLAFAHLLDETNDVAARFEAGLTDVPATVKATPAELLANLQATSAALQQADAVEAAGQLSQVIRAWPSVEGEIATRSQAAYTAIEIDLSRATAALAAQPADLTQAKMAVERLQETLAPFASQQNYTMFDASAIILREGLEALLIIVALLAFLGRSGHRHQRTWIWVGGGLGVLASIITAFILQVVFSQAAAGQNREVIEGVTGLVAAALLFYVSYWLHSQANLRTWQRYIDSKTSQALQRGSVFGLAFLSFLAVFREGAETAVFYLGMAPSIAWQDLLLGLGLGTVGLVIVAVLMLVVGVKVPLRLFFLVAGLLVYYLGFKFLGTGIHALQVAGILPASPIVSIPAIPFVGVYPTWETMVPQLLLLIAAGGVFLYLRSQRQPQGGSPAATA